MEPQPQVPVVTFSGMYPFGDFPSWPYCDVLESSREPSCVVQTKGLASGEYERLVLLCSPQRDSKTGFRVCADEGSSSAFGLWADCFMRLNLSFLFCQ